MRVDMINTTSIVEKSLKSSEDILNISKSNTKFISPGVIPKTPKKSNNEKNVTTIKNSFEALALLNNDSASSGSPSVVSPSQLSSRQGTPLTPKIIIANLENEEPSLEKAPVISHSDITYKEVNEDDTWTVVSSKRRKFSFKKGNNSRFTGEKLGTGTFKAVERSCELYIGRVQLNVNEDVIKSNIYNNFNINILGIEKINIRPESYNAFKISVNVNDRESLFKPEFCPHRIIINKFYTKRVDFNRIFYSF